MVGGGPRPSGPRLERADQTARSAISCPRAILTDSRSQSPVQDEVAPSRESAPRFGSTVNRLPHRDTVSRLPPTIAVLVNCRPFSQPSLAAGCSVRSISTTTTGEGEYDDPPGFGSEL